MHAQADSSSAVNEFNHASNLQWLINFLLCACLHAVIVHDTTNVNVYIILQLLDGSFTVHSFHDFPIRKRLEKVGNKLHMAQIC